MIVKIKKLNENAVIPSYAIEGDAAMDLTATSKWYDDNGNVCYGTGLAIQLPEDTVALIFPRSSIANKSLTLTNSVGIIDAGYTGEITFKYKPSVIINNGYVNTIKNIETPRVDNFKDYEVGDRVGQIIIIPRPYIKFEEVKELEKTKRGGGGHVS